MVIPDLIEVCGNAEIANSENYDRRIIYLLGF